MEIHKDASGALVLEGQLVVSEIELTHSKIEPLLDDTGHETVLDLTNVDDIDISGLQLIFAIRKSAMSDGSFRIRGASPKVKEVIVLSGFETLLQEVV
ncbi:MAG TPA: STAS domain-containing protein [Deltaproteobacteria bacterium]|jgi:anti-anti-sigma factor|nr:STAS domain-containing protein [Deltaproteobacteria bacterium]HOI06540.1 STAS domain-containing protein [Deltaproteobacteria bacterium]